MTINDIMYVGQTFWRVLEHNPGRLEPWLAGACAVTLIIAVFTDAWLRSRPAQPKKAVALRRETTRQ
jgi:hypothetical protein